MKIHGKYQPLFKLLRGDFEKVDTVIITGGRGSGKSFVVSLFSLHALFVHNFKILYTRFTNVSIKDSIKSEVESKIKLLGYNSLIVKESSIEKLAENKSFLGKIAFKGIKTGSNLQKANLKSIEGFNVYVTDEAEEIPDYETFKKIFYSIRSKNKRNLSILILNPTTKIHWIYEKFFNNKVSHGFNGIVDNIMYIHTSYLDVLEASPGAIPDNIVADYERMKINSPEEYEHIVMGGWIDNSDDLMFNESDLNFYSVLPDKNPIAKISFADIADSGSDFHSVPVGYIYENGDIFIDDVVFTREPTSINTMLTANLMNKHKVMYIRVESNFGGTMYIQLLSKFLEKTSALPALAKGNKHGRIMLAQWSIKKNVYFRSDWRTYSDDYFNFMTNVLTYRKDGKVKHDDAPDSLEGLITMAKDFYPKLY